MQSGSWSVSYTTGRWLLLCGPHGLLILPPGAQQTPHLVEGLWEELLAATEIDAFAERLAARGAEEPSSFGAFFWADDRLRAMARGAVKVRGAETDDVVLSGTVGLSWSELAPTATELHVVLEPIPNQPSLSEPDPMLPMVVGVARISTLLLHAEATAASTRPGADELEPTEGLASADVPVPTGGSLGPPHGSCAPAVQPSIEDDIEVFRVTSPDATPTEPFPVPAPVLAVLRSAGVEPVLMDRTVLIGRSPRVAPGAVEVPLIMIVPSPSHDISRSHVRIDVTQGRLTVTDLHSTNGTTLIRRDTALGSERLMAGHAVPVEPGDVLDLGDGVTVAIEAPTGGQEQHGGRP